MNSPMPSKTPPNDWALPWAKRRSRRKGAARPARTPQRGREAMPVITTADEARVNRRRGQAADGVSFWHTLYIGTSRYNMAEGAPDPEMGTLFPMAFLVEQDPGSTAAAHYHQADQFQVIVGGRGIMGTHEAKPVMVHFAG